MSLLSAGCSILGTRSAESQAAWDLRRAQLEQITRFTVQARVSSGLLGAKGNLHWRQRPDDFEMRVSGPMGVNAMNITGNERAVVIRTAKESFRTRDPEGLLQEQLGWTFPLRQLRWWALSLPAPGSESELELDASGRLLTLEQDGWTLEFDEYQWVGQSAGVIELPRRFELANGEATIKVVVDVWSDLAGPL
jgi:outer membrane lipoprotein LolB